MMELHRHREVVRQAQRAQPRAGGPPRRDARGRARSPACRWRASTGPSGPAAVRRRRHDATSRPPTKRAAELLERARHPHGRVRLPRLLGHPPRQAACRRAVRQEDVEAASHWRTPLHLGPRSADLPVGVRQRRHGLPGHARDARPVDAAPADVARGHGRSSCGHARPRTHEPVALDPRHLAAHRRRAAAGARLPADASPPSSSSTCATRTWQPLSTTSRLLLASPRARVRGRPERHPPQDGGVRHRRRGLQLRVRPGPDRDQPRPRRPAQVADDTALFKYAGQGDRAPARRARDLHGEAVRRCYSGNGMHVHSQPARRVGRQRLRRRATWTTRSARPR